MQFSSLPKSHLFPNINFTPYLISEYFKITRTQDGSPPLPLIQHFFCFISDSSCSSTPYIKETKHDYFNTTKRDFKECNKIKPALRFKFPEKDTKFTVSNSGQRLNKRRLRCLSFCVVNAYVTYAQMQQITTCSIIMCTNRLLIRGNGTVGPTYTKETRAYAITTHVPADTRESQVTVTSLTDMASTNNYF